MAEASHATIRRAISVRGVVQGVGFRPFVYGLATRHALGGTVRNDAGRVLIEVEGTKDAVEAFLRRLEAEPPPHARIDEVSTSVRRPCGESAFRIEASQSSAGVEVVIAPDVATCDACLREMRDPTDRRYGYPFVNCAHCGPRYTIVTGAPYDRMRTTMSGFSMCDACRAEFDDPSDRRFHAQPIACPACGPRVRAVEAAGAEVSAEPIAFAADAIRAGRIVALKGLGGFHLACDARSGAAVRALRERKHRDAKPFAVMVRDVAAASALCEVSAAERDVLESAARPIVLLRARAASVVSTDVAPGQSRLGVMLPYAPIHHLLVGAFPDAPIVMTSGNRSDEPIAFQDVEARDRLATIADVFLVHDRPIETRCDDSVALVTTESPAATTFVRRSRGLAPVPLALPFDIATPTLAMGGHLKSAFALGAGPRAYLSHHLGDLDDVEALRSYREALDRHPRLFGVEPRRIVHDLHPDYASSREAKERGTLQGLPTLAVQHHHAHMASCMAEHGLQGPVLGVCFDGAGLGTDGALWGGEFLVGGYRSYLRAAHFEYLPLAGGERAMREPWRAAVALLHAAGMDVTDTALAARLPHGALRSILAILERPSLCVSTSSVGRLFDAVASLVGTCDVSSFEGQAAMGVEGLAADVDAEDAYPVTFRDGTPRIVETRGLAEGIVRDLGAGTSPARIASRFHATLVEAVVRVCGRIRDEHGVDAVVLSGGVFVNARLSTGVTRRLTGAGFRVHRHHRVPPNDGGLCLGQLAVAAASEEGV